MPDRIAIIADIHLGRAGREPDGSVVGDIAPILRHVVRKLIELDPQAVILLGDIVNRGFPAEYDQARRIFAPLDSRLVPVVGNHELQRAGVGDFERAWRAPASREIRIGPLPALVLNGGIEGLPDNCWSGRLAIDQIDRLARFLDEHAGQPVIVFCHYPIAGTVARSDEPMFALENSADVAGIVRRHTSNLVWISAHTHRASCIRDGRFAYLCCPPLGFWPHSMLVLECSSRQIAFQTVRFLDHVQDRIDPSSIDPAYRAAAEGAETDRQGVISLDPQE